MGNSLRESPQLSSLIAKSSIMETVGGTGISRRGENRFMGSKRTVRLRFSSFSSLSRLFVSFFVFHSILIPYSSLLHLTECKDVFFRNTTSPTTRSAGSHQNKSLKQNYTVHPMNLKTSPTYPYLSYYSFHENVNDNVYSAQKYEASAENVNDDLARQIQPIHEKVTDLYGHRQKGWHVARDVKPGHVADEANQNHNRDYRAYPENWKLHEGAFNDSFDIGDGPEESFRKEQKSASFFSVGDDHGNSRHFLNRVSSGGDSERSRESMKFNDNPPRGKESPKMMVSPWMMGEDGELSERHGAYPSYLGDTDASADLAILQDFSRRVDGRAEKKAPEAEISNKIRDELLNVRHSQQNELRRLFSIFSLTSESSIETKADNLALQLQQLLNLGPTASLLIGLLLTVFGSALMAAGSILMKLGLHLEAEKKQQDDESVHGFCEPTWWSGFAAYSFGSGLHIVALGFAPASILAPMNSVGLIANAVSASTILKEPFGWTEGITTVGTVIGVTLCASASLLPHDETGMGGAGSGTDGLASWTDPWYLCYLASCIVSGFGTLVFVNQAESRMVEEREEMLLSNSRGGFVEMTQQPPMTALGHTASGIPIHESCPPSPNSLEGGEVSGDVRSAAMKASAHPRGVGLGYGFLAGLVGAQCVLELKEFSACIQYGLENPMIWHFPQPYLVAAFFILTVFLQLHFLNLGLARGEATVVVPTYYVVWTFFGTFGGFAKFHEIQGYSVGAMALFGFGFSITVACIAILAVQEMLALRRFVDERVPDVRDDLLDLETQELRDQQLGKRVTLAMGLFPFSMLGRTVGRRRFRPLYQRFRRTRSTASDTALGDTHGELTVGTNAMLGAFTLPHNMHFNRNQTDYDARYSATVMRHDYSLEHPNISPSSSSQQGPRVWQYDTSRYLQRSAIHQLQPPHPPPLSSDKEVANDSDAEGSIRSHPDGLKSSVGPVNAAGRHKVDERSSMSILGPDGVAVEHNARSNSRPDRCTDRKKHPSPGSSSQVSFQI